MDEFDRAYVADLQRISDQRATNLMAAWDRNAALEAELATIKAEYKEHIAAYDALVLEMVQRNRPSSREHHVESSDKDWLIQSLTAQLAEHESTWK